MTGKAERELIAVGGIVAMVMVALLAVNVWYEGEEKAKSDSVVLRCAVDCRPDRGVMTTDGRCACIGWDGKFLRWKDVM